MTAAGYDPGSDGRSISLYNLGIEQPIGVNDGGDSHFDPSDSIEFYAYGIDTVSTGANTYWLRAGNGNNGSPVPLSSITGCHPVTSSVPYTDSRVQRSIFFFRLTN